jgi:peptide deformylase
MINPIIEERDGELKRCPGEGCLSLPGVRVDTVRYEQVTAKWFDYDRKEEQRAVFYGFEAQVVQHELDHLDGLLITDRKFSQTKVGRNDPCPCGSGKKFKKCCLQ